MVENSLENLNPQNSKSEIIEQELLHSYSLRPKISQKFRSADVKEILHTILTSHLTDKEFNMETCSDWTKSICSDIKEKLKNMNYDRYKFVVQCVIGEQRGAGINMSGRCFWDSDTDNYAESIYMNESLFCVAAAYAVYYY